MEIVEDGTQLATHVHHLGLGKRPAGRLDAHVQVVAFNQLHHKVIVAALAEVVDHFGQAGMIQVRENPGLLLELPQERAGWRPTLLPELLDRPAFACQALVGGDVDAALTAGTEPVDADVSARQCVAR